MPQNLVTVKVPAEVRVKAKVYAAQNNLTIYEVFSDALEQMLLRKTKEN